jgi:hypothetical protein
MLDLIFDFLGSVLVYPLYYTGFLLLRLFYPKNNLQKWDDNDENIRNIIKTNTIILTGGLFWLLGLLIIVIIVSFYQ